LCRGRITALRHFDGVGVVVELRPEQPMSAVDLGIPAKVVDVVRGGRGLVLMVGERGIGRTEVMAAILREVAADRDRYVIVLDDAIDCELPPAGALVARRRVGEHVTDYQSGLRIAVREDPDAIVIGSVGEAGAFDMAMRAAESGRLVVAWLDSTSVVAAFERILCFYPEYDVARVRATLASVLRAICVRMVMPSRSDEPGVSATELLLVNEPVRDVLRGGSLEQIERLMRLDDGGSGHSLDNSMFDHLCSGQVRMEDAFLRASDKAWLLDRVRDRLPAEI
jgi:twitching motility protein PilT